MNEIKPHHLSGRKWSLERRAKIATSMRVKREKNPALWQRLFRVNLEMLQIEQELPKVG